MEYLYHQAKLPVKEITKELEEVTSKFYAASHEKTVAVIGSSRLNSTHPTYMLAKVLAKKLANLGFTILTGGGSGIMEAANQGSHEVGGTSLGICMDHLNENSRKNSFLTENESMNTQHFFIRKLGLLCAAKALLVFPGGYGTLDELMEFLTMIAVQNIPPIPIILIGKSFWTPLVSWLENTLLKEEMISSKGLAYLRVEDDQDQILKTLNNLPCYKLT